MNQHLYYQYITQRSKASDPNYNYLWRPSSRTDTWLLDGKEVIPRNFTEREVISTYRMGQSKDYYKYNGSGYDVLASSNGVIPLQGYREDYSRFILSSGRIQFIYPGLYMVQCNAEVMSLLNGVDQQQYSLIRATGQPRQSHTDSFTTEPSGDRNYNATVIGSYNAGDNVDVRVQVGPNGASGAGVRVLSEEIIVQYFGDHQI